MMRKSIMMTATANTAVAGLKPRRRRVASGVRTVAAVRSAGDCVRLMFWRSAERVAPLVLETRQHLDHVGDGGLVEGEFGERLRAFWRGHVGAQGLFEVLGEDLRILGAGHEVDQ